MKNGYKLMLNSGIWLENDGENNPLNFELINNVTIWLVKVIVEERDPEILEDALSALDYLTEKLFLTYADEMNVIECLIHSGCLIKLGSVL